MFPAKNRSNLLSRKLNLSAIAVSSKIGFVYLLPETLLSAKKDLYSGFDTWVAS
jgi:hypothetical protein